MNDEFFDYEALEKTKEMEKITTLLIILTLISILVYGSILSGVIYGIYKIIT